MHNGSHGYGARRSARSLVVQCGDVNFGAPITGRRFDELKILGCLISVLSLQTQHAPRVFVGGLCTPRKPESNQLYPLAPWMWEWETRQPMV
jgi:hypothetical protein